MSDPMNGECGPEVIASNLMADYKTQEGTSEIVIVLVARWPDPEQTDFTLAIASNCNTPKTLSGIMQAGVNRVQKPQRP